MINKTIVRLMGAVVMVFAFMHSANAMTFTVETVRGGTERYIQGSGVVELGDKERLQEVLDNSNLPVGTYLSLHSPGGLVSVAHELGLIVRDGELNTVIVASNVCLSACTDIFLGGNTRIMEQEGGLGYHAASLQYMDGGLTLNNVLEYGQFIGVTDMFFGLLMITPGHSIQFASLLYDVHVRDESSVFLFPTNETLLNAGITTR